MNLGDPEYLAKLQKHLGADFTFIYDDQSYDAPDLQTGMPRDDAKQTALIRTRFKSAAMDALETLKRYRFAHTATIERRQFHSLRLMSLTDFMKQSLADKNWPYAGLPVLIIAVAFYFVEVWEEDNKSVHAVYYSPSVIEMMARINQQLRHGYQYTARELAETSRDSALAHLEAFELIPDSFRDPSKQFITDLDRRVKALRNAIHRHFPKNHKTETLFVHTENKQLQEHNEFAIDSVIGNAVHYAQENLFKDRDMQSSAALQELITHGLADESRPEWSEFLKKGLYYPWLFMLVNYYLEPKKRE